MKSLKITTLLTSAILLVTACGSNEVTAQKLNTTEQSSQTQESQDQAKNLDQSSQQKGQSKESKSSQTTKMSTTMITDIYNEAAKGKMFFNESVSIGMSKAQVISIMGQPEKDSNTELNYPLQSISFSLDQGKVIFITSNHTKFQNLTGKQVKQELGKPKAEEHIPDTNLTGLKYTTGKYEVIFVYNENNDSIEYIDIRKG